MLRREGISIFNVSEISLCGQELKTEVWEALAGSRVLVALLKRSETLSPSMAVEIGGAIAWEKPVFILIRGGTTYRQPFLLSEYRIFSMTEVNRVVKEIKMLKRESEKIDVNALKKAYVEVGVPTDMLLHSIVLRRRLIQKLRHKYGIMLDFEVVMRELLRIRKQGKLPRIPRKGIPLK